jgi:hypothetical protein
MTPMAETIDEFAKWLEKHQTSELFVSTDIWNAMGRPPGVRHNRYLEPGTMLGIIPPFLPPAVTRLLRWPPVEIAEELKTRLVDQC